MKQLFKNVLSLSGLQLLHYFIPVLLLPLVVRVLGPDRFGLVNVAQSLVWYFVLIINYGFEVSATRDIALQVQDPVALRQTFATVMGTKLRLLGLSALVYGALVWWVPAFRAEAWLYAAYFLLAIGYALMPNWFFMGIQRYQQALGIYVAVRLLSLLAIYLLVHQPSDYVLYVLLLGLAQGLAGGLGLVVSLRKYGMRLYHTSLGSSVLQLQQGFPIFIGLVVSGVMSSTYLFILGQTSPASEAGYFAAVLRLLLAVMGVVFVPLGQVLLPRVSQRFAADRLQGFQALQGSLLVVLAGGLGVALVLWLGAGIWVGLFFGKNYQPAISLMPWVAMVPCINACCHVLGTQGMLNLNMGKTYMAVNTVVMIAGTLALIPLCHYGGATGAAAGWLLVEVLNLVLLATTLYRRHPQVFRFGPLAHYLQGGSFRS